MVTARLSEIEHAKQLVAHGAHAADIEVVQALLTELERVIIERDALIARLNTLESALLPEGLRTFPIMPPEILG